MKLTVKLPGGTLRAAGRVRENGPLLIRVLGGTGDFANARGTSEARSLNASGTLSLNVYRLKLP